MLRLARCVVWIAFAATACDSAAVLEAPDGSEEIAPNAPASRGPEIRQPNGERLIPPRAVRPWREEVAAIQAEYRKDPNAARFQRRPRMRAATRPIAANEAAPVENILTEWWCDPNSPDAWDRMWMSIIAGGVRAGARPLVYLHSSSVGPTTALDRCRRLLEEEEGIDADEVTFFQDFATDAFWMRDFGPIFVRDRESAALSIRDAHYYPRRPNDDAIPEDFGRRFDLPVRDFPLSYEGGNFLPNGGGLCLVGSVAAERNPHYSEEDLNNLFADELGCDELVIVESLNDFATGHIDMWMSWADRTTLVVGEYTDSQDSENRGIIERNIADKLTGLTDPETGEAIEIVRMPMPSNCPRGFSPLAPDSCPGTPGWRRTWRTYLNVLLINDTVLVPTYEAHAAQEDEAVTVWEQLGYTVERIPSDHIITSFGAIHCITKSLDRGPVTR